MHQLPAQYNNALSLPTSTCYIPKTFKNILSGTPDERSVPTLQCNLEFNENSFVKDDKYKLKFCRYQVVKQIIYDLQVIKCPPFKMDINLKQRVA